MYKIERVTLADMVRITDEIAMFERWYDAETWENIRECEADRLTELRTEQYYEGAFATDACWAENQADLDLHNSLHPDGYR